MTADSPTAELTMAPALVPSAAAGRRAPRGLRARRVMAVTGLLLLAAAAFAGIAVAGLDRVSTARAAVAATNISDAYQDALHAAAVEQSLERAWRLGRQPEVMTWQARAARGLEEALGRVASSGSATDRAVVDRARASHAAHLAAVAQAVRTGKGADAAAAEATSEDLQDVLSDAAQRAYAFAAAAREETTLPLGLLVVLFVVAAGATAAALVVALGAAGRNARRYAALRDRTERLTFRDALTGLPNRAVLRDRLEQALLLGQREQTSTALLVLDLDRFKEINDALGHDYGDQLLAQIGPRLCGPLRGSDTVARLGGDEFGVLLPKVQDLSAALLVAEKLQATLLEPFRINGLPLSVEASIGVVIAPDHGIDGGTLLQRGDVAMYVAKDAGLGISSYDENLDGSSPARAAMLGELRRAIEENELVLDFQPKCAVATGALEGVEALVRWQHPTQGLLPPDRFLPLAERTGLVHPLTRHVLAAALAECRRWLDLGIELPVAVNLSARTLLDRNFAHDVEQMLAYWRVPGHLLELEVTETAVMADPERARALMELLAELGVVLAIDDFGTGYSSLVSLRTLPVHDLKIDRMFVTEMLSNPNDAFIVRSVIALAHDVGLRVVAEGVESAETLDALRELGCDVAQGYHLGRPMSGPELGRLLAGPGSDVVRPARPLSDASR